MIVSYSHSSLFTVLVPVLVLATVFANAEPFARIYISTRHQCRHTFIRLGNHACGVCARRKLAVRQLVFSEHDGALNKQTMPDTAQYVDVWRVWACVGVWVCVCASVCEYVTLLVEDGVYRVQKARLVQAHGGRTSAHGGYESYES